MTEAAAARSAQGRSIIDTISKVASAKSAANALRASSKSSDELQEPRARPLDQDRNDIDKSSTSDQRTKISATNSSAKTTEGTRDTPETSDDGYASFESTIDDLGNQPKGDTTSGSSALAVASSELTLRLATQDEASSLKPTALPGHLLKRASIDALLEARQRLMSAQDSAMPDQADVDTLQFSISVHSRQTHMLLVNADAGASTRTAETFAANDGKLSPLVAATQTPTVKSEAGDDDSGKMTPGVRMPAPPVVNDAASRQSSSGAQGDGAGPRQQTAGSVMRPTGEAMFAADAEHVSRSHQESAGNMAGATLQVRSGIVAALGDGTNRLVSNPPQIVERPAVGTILRTIDLTLAPPDLGTIRLKLSLKSSALDIDAEASKASTARLLDSDRSGLEQSLRDAGYDVKSLKISDSSPGASLNGALNNGNAPSQDGSQARTNFTGRQDDGAQRRDGEMPNQSQQRHRDNDRNPSPASDSGSSRQANAIYI